MKIQYKKGDPVYIDFEGNDKTKQDKFKWCANCERWIPPPYKHTCHCKAGKERQVL